MPSVETMDRDFQSHLVWDVGGGLWWSSSELLLLAGRFAGCWLGGKTLTGSGENRSLIKFMQEQSTSKQSTSCILPGQLVVSAFRDARDNSPGFRN